MMIIASDLHSDYCCEKELFGENQVNGRVSGLPCTWLVSRTRASSDDLDGFLTLRVDPLKEVRSTWRAWPNRLTQDVPRGRQISYSAAVDLVAELGLTQTCKFNITISGFNWVTQEMSLDDVRDCNCSFNLPPKLSLPYF
ncbi:hypothetical protein M9H77_21964 [Catharanthus roseus]|uniref:Uncharacterized protein n=1 Tax=Catharanthus roseus TaxID=4058 RepID=A0ACC0AT63_CATRO|nr:hypothetical protein M9H77_21964 [Catharanthus roseus]